MRRDGARGRPDRAVPWSKAARRLMQINSLSVTIGTVFRSASGQVAIEEGRAPRLQQVELPDIDFRPREAGLATPGASTEFDFSVAAMAPSARHRRAAIAAVVLLTLAVVAVAPFAATQLPEIGSFVPVVEAIILATDLTTAILLFTQ